jgi:CRISPR-associated endonuclease Cas1
MSKDGQYPRSTKAARGGHRSSWTVTPERAADILAGLEAGFAGDDPAGPAVAVVLGAGAKVRVERGHLIVSDGEGWFRRERRFNRATSRLARLVIGASSGYLSISGMAWCRDAGVAVIIVDSDGEVMLGPGRYGADDARLRRAQAAPAEALRLEAAAMLLGAKLTGQADVAGRCLERPDAATTIAELAEQLGAAGSVDECRQLEASAAAVYFDTWCRNVATTLRFARGDAARVPAHWPIFEGRRSLLTKGTSAKRAERPLNSVLNLSYRLAGIEARLAAVALGLDPGLGFVHADAVRGDGLAWDLVEPIRPAVDRFVLDLVAERTWRRADFVERSDGSIRLAPPLVQELAGTMPAWAKLVAPYAEAIAHLLGRAVRGAWEPRTPLSGAKAAAARARVRARPTESGARISRSVQAKAAALRAHPDQAGLFATCVDCGGPLTRPRHVRCEACWSKTPAQSSEVRRRRGRAIAAAVAGLHDWKAEHGDAKRPSPEAFAPIRDGLAGVKLTEIMAATELSKSTASQIRSGRTVPHVRHWPALAELAGLPRVPGLHHSAPV